MKNSGSIRNSQIEDSLLSFQLKMWLHCFGRIGTMTKWKLLMQEPWRTIEVMGWLSVTTAEESSFSNRSKSIAKTVSLLMEN
jgi:hypothetical protein